MVLVGGTGSFGLTLLWGWADSTGYTKRKAMEKVEKRAGPRQQNKKPAGKVPAQATLKQSFSLAPKASACSSTAGP